MNPATGADDGIEFRWLTLSTGQCASISIQNTERVFFDKVNTVLSTMMECELENSNFRVVDDPTWQLFGEAAIV